ncbi:MAG: MFS transporter, partial [Proteobacteria bacterium]|nr:MFS transporter [Pseudomonadota bacterium]
MTTPHPKAAKRRNIVQMAAIFAALAFAYFLSEFFRISHAVIGPDLMAELGFSVSGLSLLTSVFFFAFAAQQLPNGLLFDRFGPRR